MIDLENLLIVVETDDDGEEHSSEFRVSSENGEVELTPLPDKQNDSKS